MSLPVYYDSDPGFAYFAGLEVGTHCQGPEAERANEAHQIIEERKYKSLQGNRSDQTEDKSDW